ncbi:hypothetical protein bcgnr5390_00320 [Bacillus luti]
MFNFSAAFVKCNSFETAKKYFSCRNSIGITSSLMIGYTYHYYINNRIEQ